MSGSKCGSPWRRGFTLIEMMVVVLIFGLVSVGLYQVLTTSRGSYEQQKVTLEMQQNARAGLEALADDFRHVSYGKDPTQPSIHYAGPDSVTFVADIMPGVSGAERITYFLSPDGDPDTPNPDDTILMKVVADSAGVALLSQPQSYGIAAGGLTLRYFNGAGVELANPVPQPELIGEILIQVTAVEPRMHPRLDTFLEETLSTTVYPRNLPLTPARSRPSTPQLSIANVPNCESITIHWTTPTTNTDETPLPLEDISHFTLYFGTDPDTMSIYSRLARTINDWTIPGLVGGHHYYFGVTCTSRSGVESYPGHADHDLSSPLYPDAPTGLTSIANPGGAGLRLQWNIVTQFEDGTPITTTLNYRVYRASSPGVQPLSGSRIAIVPVSNFYVDASAEDCAQYYYIVTAEACGNEGSPSAEAQASRPALCDCIGSLALGLTANAGEIQVQWSAPTLRIDGAPLPLDEIEAYRIYYDTVPHGYAAHTDVPAPASSYLLSGLATCQTYFVNVAAIDQCAHQGRVCESKEQSVRTSEPCDADPPAAPAALRASSVADRIDLTWPANEIDCDLRAYRLYYGLDPGGPYTGTGAAEGPSPIYLDPAVVLDGDSCRTSLSGLSPCESYSLVVRTIDNCEPPNESSSSPEATVQIDCTPCAVDAGCARYATTGATQEQVRLEIYPSDAQAVTLTDLLPNWSGPAAVRQAWAGRPLVKIWDADGSAGDGPAGLQPSNVPLDVDNFVVPSNARRCDGLPLMLVFNADQRQQSLGLTFRTANGFCDAADRTVAAGLAFDDFDDGNYNGWTVQSGTWSVVNGALYQSRGTGSSLITLPGSLTDFVYEVKLKNTSGQSPYLVFRYLNSLNYYMLNILTTDDVIRLCKYQSGSFVVTAQTGRALANNVWYMLRVVVTGKTAQAYIDCDLVLSVTDNAMQASGLVGLRDYSSKTYFDDVRVTGATPLP